MKNRPLLDLWCFTVPVRKCICSILQLLKALRQLIF